MVCQLINVAKNRHTAKWGGFDSQQYTFVLVILCVLACLLKLDLVDELYMFWERCEKKKQPFLLKWI